MVAACVQSVSKLSKCKYTLVLILTTRTPVSVCVFPPLLGQLRAVDHAALYVSTYSKYTYAVTS